MGPAWLCAATAYVAWASGTLEPCLVLLRLPRPRQGQREGLALGGEEAPSHPPPALSSMHSGPERGRRDAQTSPAGPRAGLQQEEAPSSARPCEGGGELLL